MPDFGAFFVEPVGHPQAKQVGKLFSIPIAPPSDPHGEPTREAYFFPGDRRTLLSQQAADDYGYNANLPDEEIVIRVRDFYALDPHNDQLNISVKNADVHVCPGFPDDVIVICGDEIKQRFNFVNWSPPHTYASAPAYLELKHKRQFGCYSWV